MSLLPSISSNNLTEIDSLRLNGQIGVFSPSSVKKQNYEGSFVVAHDDRAFYCVLRHKDPRQPLVQKVKLNNTTKIQDKPNGIVVIADNGTIIRISAHDGKRGNDTNFCIVLRSAVALLKRITKDGLTVGEYKGTQRKKSGPLDCASRYSAQMFEFSSSEEDENSVVNTSDRHEQPSQPVSFLNPNATDWITQDRTYGRANGISFLSNIDKDLMRESKPKASPKPPSYGKRQVLAAQDNIEKKSSPNSFYGVDGDNSSDDFTPSSYSHSARFSSQVNVVGSKRLLPFISASPSNQPKNTNHNRSLSQSQSSHSSIMSSFRQSTLSIPYTSQSGFSNLGNTCYMNSILQALLGLKSFAEDLKASDTLERMGKGSFYRALHGLLVAKENRAKSDVRRDALCDVKKCLETAVGRYRGGRQQDAHEFLCFVFDLLDSEVEQAAKRAMEDLSFSHLTPASLHSPVTVNFACNTRSTLVCKGCGHKNFTDEMFLTFPIALSDSRPAVGVASVQSMFIGFFDDYEVGHNCGCGHGKGTVSRSVTSLPRVLVVFLKRYQLVNQTYMKRTDRVRIPRILSLDDVCDVRVKPPHDFVCKKETKVSPADNSKRNECPSPSLLRDKWKQTEIPKLHYQLRLSPAAEKLKARTDLYIQNMSEDEQLKMALEQSQCTVENQTALRVLPSKEPASNVMNNQAPLRRDKPLSEWSEEEQIQRAIEESKLLLNNQHHHSCDKMDFETNKENWVVLRIPGQLDGTDRQSPNSESVYESSGNTPFLFTKRKSLSGDKRKRENSVEPIMKLVEDNGPSSRSRKRLCLDTPSTEQLVTQLSGENSSVTPVQPFTLSDSDEDEEFSKAMFIDASSGKQHVAGNTPMEASRESLQDADSHETEKKNLAKAMACSLAEHHDMMTEEEQLKHALSLSLQECGDVQCLDLGESSDDEMIPDSEVEPKIGNERHAYRLVSVVSHIGKGSRTGHYLCDVYDPTARVWKSCDDSTVRDIEELEVRQKRSTTGYIFFYMHKKIFSAIDIKKS